MVIQLPAYRERYLREHENDYPFPQDGSDWARLVGVEKYFAHHPHNARKKDLYFFTHTNAMMDKQRSGILRALHYWFLLGPSHAALPPTYTPEKTAQEIAWDRLLQLGSDPSLLLEAEKRWLEKQSNTFHLSYPKAGPFWQGGDAEMWEQRTPISNQIPGSLPPAIEGDDNVDTTESE